jgi:hypothetical protein
MNPNKLDEYAMRPINSQPLFIRTVEYLGETQIDIMRIEIVPRYDRQFDVRPSAFGPGTSNERYRTETVRTLDEDYGKHVKTFTDGSKMGAKVGYAVVKEEHTPHNKDKNSTSKHGVQCGSVYDYWSNPIVEKYQTRNSDND